MSRLTDQRADPIAIPLGQRPRVGFSTIAVGFIALVTLGILGRLVPPPAAPQSVVTATVGPSLAQEVQLVSPFGNVLYRRTTEIAVRGSAPPGTEQVDVAVLIGRESIGEARLDVDSMGRFNGLVPIIPPKARSIALLEVRDPASQGRLLREVSFAVQAASLILPRDPSTLRGQAGMTLVVDVLVYGPLGEIRGLLTSVDGRLLATGSSAVAPPASGTGWPRTVSLRIEIPLEALPARAHLHVLAIDRNTTEVEHIDANVGLSNG